MVSTYLPKLSFAELELQKNVHLEPFEKGEQIPFPESGFWQVYRGIIQLNKINLKGEEITIGWISPDRVFGSCVGDVSSYKAIASCNVLVRKYSYKDIENSVDLGRMLIEELSYRLLYSEKMISIQSLKKVEDRLWELITFLKSEMSYSVAKGHRLPFHLTHQNLANAISSTRVTITRLLGEFQEKGWIEVDKDRHIIIKNKRSSQYF